MHTIAHSLSFSSFPPRSRALYCFAFGLCEHNIYIKLDYMDNVSRSHHFHCRCLYHHVDNYIIDVLLLAHRRSSALLSLVLCSGLLCSARAFAVVFIVQLTMNNFHSFDRSVPLLHNVLVVISGGGWSVTCCP
jgi:hypothetical protein